MPEENKKKENSMTRHMREIWQDHHDSQKKENVKLRRIREQRKKSKIKDYGL